MTGTDYRRYLDIHSHDRGDGNDLVVLSLSPGNAAVRGESLKEPFSAGLHPWYAGNRENDATDLNILKGLVNRKDLVAIGEAGLDRHTDLSMEYQEEIFTSQAEIASKAGKPIIIHCVRAFPEIIRLRKKFSKSPPWIIHGFTGNQQVMEQLLSHDFYLSFGTAIEDPVKKTIDVLKKVPVNRIFFETDDKSVRVSSVYRAFSSICQIEHDILKREIWQNFYDLFGKLE